MSLDVVDAMLRLAPDLDMRLILVGDGPGREAICAEADRRGLSRVVRCIGSTSDPRPLLASADAYLSTSLWEGLPLALVEAAMEAVPIVASDVVGNRDVVHAIGGGLFRAGDSEAAGRLIISLARDAASARLAAEAARLRAKHTFDVRIMAARTLGIYAQAIRPSRAIPCAAHGLRLMESTSCPA